MGTQRRKHQTQRGQSRVKGDDGYRREIQRPTSSSNLTVFLSIAILISLVFLIFLIVLTNNKKPKLSTINTQTTSNQASNLSNSQTAVVPVAPAVTPNANTPAPVVPVKTRSVKKTVEEPKEKKPNIIVDIVGEKQAEPPKEVVQESVVKAEEPVEEKEPAKNPDEVESPKRFFNLSNPEMEAKAREREERRKKRGQGEE